MRACVHSQIVVLGACHVSAPAFPVYFVRLDRLFLGACFANMRALAMALLVFGSFCCFLPWPLQNHNKQVVRTEQPCGESTHTPGWGGCYVGHVPLRRCFCKIDETNISAAKGGISEVICPGREHSPGPRPWPGPNIRARALIYYCVSI